MIIKTTTNSVAAAVIFTVFSGISSLGNANLQEVDVKFVRVSYADFNLNGAAGQETLYQRLRGAADQVCGEVQTRPPARFGKSTNALRMPSTMQCTRWAIRICSSCTRTSRPQALVAML